MANAKQNELCLVKFYQEIIIIIIIIVVVVVEENANSAIYLILKESET